MRYLFLLFGDAIGWLSPLLQVETTNNFFVNLVFDSWLIIKINSLQKISPRLNIIVLSQTVYMGILQHMAHVLGFGDSFGKPAIILQIT